MFLRNGRALSATVMPFEFDVKMFAVRVELSPYRWLAPVLVLTVYIEYGRGKIGIEALSAILVEKYI